MSPAPTIDVTSHMDGACIRFDGRVVDVFDTIAAAWRWRPVALEALAMLADCLAKPSPFNSMTGVA